MQKKNIIPGNTAIKENCDLECKAQDLLNLSTILFKNCRNHNQQTFFFTW